MADTKLFTLAEVAESSSATKPLIVINNAVYDVTNFLNEVSIFVTNQSIFPLISYEGNLVDTYCLVNSFKGEEPRC
jgi:hypothetical protein